MPLDSSGVAAKFVVRRPKQEGNILKQCVGIIVIIIVIIVFINLIFVRGIFSQIKDVWQEPMYHLENCFLQIPQPLRCKYSTCKGKEINNIVFQDYVHDGLLCETLF